MSAEPVSDDGQDARFLAQERIVDALLRALALNQPDLLSTVRDILVATEFTHTGKPGLHETVHQQIGNRLDQAARFADQYGTISRTPAGRGSRH